MHKIGRNEIFPCQAARMGHCRRLIRAVNGRVAPRTGFIANVLALRGGARCGHAHARSWRQETRCQHNGCDHAFVRWEHKHCSWSAYILVASRGKAAIETKAVEGRKEGVTDPLHSKRNGSALESKFNPEVQLPH